MEPCYKLSIIHRICALEYERRQEMAAAALAYKCIEVAYMRIVYHKHSSINGDRHEMHSLFRTIVQGNRKMLCYRLIGKLGAWNFASWKYVLSLSLISPIN